MALLSPVTKEQRLYSGTMEPAPSLIGLYTYHVCLPSQLPVHARNFWIPDMQMNESIFGTDSTLNVA